MPFIDGFKPWRALHRDEGSFLIDQTKKEVGPGHVLFDRVRDVLARRDDVNDILFALDDGHFARVHLTWEKLRPCRPPLPWTVVYPCVEAAMEEARQFNASPPSFDPAHPANRWASRNSEPTFTPPPDEAAAQAMKPFELESRLGTHPDTVLRLWRELNFRLPRNCCCIVDQCPALATPSKGVVIAMGFGTSYAIRVACEVARKIWDAFDASDQEWVGLQYGHVERTFGRDNWIVGNWKDTEFSWLRTTFNQAELAH
jgi:hypothetical protein